MFVTWAKMAVSIGEPQSYPQPPNTLRNLWTDSYSPQASDVLQFSGSGHQLKHNLGFM